MSRMFCGVYALSVIKTKSFTSGAYISSNLLATNILVTPTSWSWSVGKICVFTFRESERNISENCPFS